MLKVGSKFYTFDELSRRLEEFQELEQVQLWVRDSRTVVAAAKRARRKSLNPALKYAELTYSCVFGGRRPSDQTKIHNQTSAGGCPFKVRLSTSNDGQALVVKEICHEHNHEPGKKLHEEPRRLYKKTQNRTTVRKPVRYIVNKRVTSSTNNKTKSRLDHTESHVQLGQSPFHHLHLHQQQYQQQQQQLKLQLQQHLQQQQQQQQQLRQKQAEVIQLDSPDHLDTPDHLSSPDLSTNFDQLGSLNNSVDQYSYLPPSPISPSLSSGCPVDFEEDERLEPILDLEEALEEALGDLDSVGSMEVDANLRLTSVGCTTPTLVSHAEAVYADDHTGPPPAKRQRGRPRKQSFTGSTFDSSVDIPDLDFSLSDLMDFDVYLF
ncbi:putative mediator of RNA polymerase II transcription subunit 12 [Homarus americanus]|uniref:putative mediator of RNA polymerase II transcription subunit 12 n=1 Tax=Homarus americanus TaxID=6706 RepID=UPI001C439D7A|nr:putative mediator of RNA polymerase II transcription subunit 12 [Homarus americanus]XP_042226444.1 putative mediator of RNA polymerase II transcription subunit 12 [Homarus americanus]XP_042226450.1 putative mediator of RNA polymerase II transcription subunit 12 [Homarus americanus]